MRLIDADLVLAHIKPYEPTDEDWAVTGGTAIRLIESAVNNAPTVDAMPVVHGKWIYDHWCEFRCSRCGTWSKSEPYRGRENFCPNCGARMDGGVNDAAD